MIEFIIILAVVAAAGLITREILDEKHMVEAYDKAIAIMATEKEEDLEWHEGLEWYDWVDLSTCDICDEFMAEGEAILRIVDEDSEAFDEKGFRIVEVITACEYCLNPDLKDE